MARRLLSAALILACAVLPARAAPDGVQRLLDALLVPQLMTVMEREGQRYGDTLEAELFPGAGGTRWAEAVARIHDPARMEGIVTTRVTADLGPRAAEVEAMVAFFTSERGKRIVELELAAREALLDPDVKEAAELAAADLPRVDAGRRALIDAFVAANDLVESNVAGALNSNLAFYRGMVSRGAMDPAVGESDMMADLWSQEPQIREETETWVYAYLTLAYQPLSDDDLTAYIDFSRTPAGKALNAALFAAFDTMFATLSQDLGAAAATHLQGEDL